MFGKFRNTENIVDQAPRLAGGVETTSSAVTELDHLERRKVRIYFDIFQDFFSLNSYKRFKSFGGSIFPQVIGIGLTKRLLNVLSTASKAEKLRRRLNNGKINPE